MSSDSLPEPLQKLFEWVFDEEQFHTDYSKIAANISSHIDANKTKYIDALREAVAIKSVSAWPAYRPDLSKMIHWTADKLKELGAIVELADVGFETIYDGCPLALPEIILGSLGNVCKANKYCALLKCLFPVGPNKKNCMRLRAFRCATGIERRRMGHRTICFDRKRRQTFWTGRNWWQRPCPVLASCHRLISRCWCRATCQHSICLWRYGGKCQRRINGSA